VTDRSRPSALWWSCLFSSSNNMFLCLNISARLPCCSAYTQSPKKHNLCTNNGC